MSEQRYLRGTTILDVGFDSDGGFYVIDHVARVAAYAYPTSTHATQAKSRPGYVVAQMLKSINQAGIPAKINEDHYVAVCRSIPKAK